MLTLTLKGRYPGTWVYNWCADRDATFQQVAAELEIALALDDNDSDAPILAALNVNREDHDKAAYHQERAPALNPNDLVVVQQGELLTCSGDRRRASTDGSGQCANPYHPERFWNHLGACYCAEKYAEAVAAFSRITRLDYTITPFSQRHSAQMGNSVAGAAHAAES
jgi:adenylate cyclase